MVNKKKLAKLLSQRTVLTQKEAENIVEEIFEIILEEVQEDEVSIVGFGKFYSYLHNPRPVRNPKTQEEMVLKPYRSLRFKASDVVKKFLKDSSK